MASVEMLVIRPCVLVHTFAAFACWAHHPFLQVCASAGFCDNSASRCYEPWLCGSNHIRGINFAVLCYCISADNDFFIIPCPPMAHTMEKLSFGGRSPVFSFLQALPHDMHTICEI